MSWKLGKDILFRIVDLQEFIIFTVAENYKNNIALKIGMCQLCVSFHFRYLLMLVL